MGTTNTLLEKWCKFHNVVGLQGVFSSNNVTAPYQPKDACWIVNHSPSFSPSASGGSHWVACRVKGTTAFWFDSYGLPPHAQLENALMGSKSDPAHPHFDRWLERMGVETVVYNDRDLQSVSKYGPVPSSPYNGWCDLPPFFKGKKLEPGVRQMY